MFRQAFKGLMRARAGRIGFIRLLNNLFFIPRYTLNEKEIVILGKGASIENLRGFQTNIKTVILVNAYWDNWGDDIAYYKHPLIHEFIKNRELILVCNPGQPRQHIKPFLKRYNVAICFQNSFNKTIRVEKPKKYFSNFPDEVIPSCEHMLNNFRHAGALGTAILLCRYKYNIKTFYIFGLDFYELNYFINANHDWSKEKKTNSIIKESWVNFMKHHSDCTFNLFTNARLRSEDNIVVKPPPTSDLD